MSNPITGAEIVQNAVEQAQERRKALLKLHQSGKSYSEIAKQVGISRQRVTQLVKLARAEAA